MGESILANELLPQTKGHAMGFLAVAIGFGLAFGVSIAWMGGISAHLNPAMLFFLAILGKLQDGWVEFVVLSCMTGTAALTFGAEMFNLRCEFDSSVNSDGAYTQALFVSLFITLLILGLGGTTGLAVNPARDAGPRLAHSLLPIPGKGSSEWHYGWVPILAPLVGAALGAGVFRGMELLFETGTVVDTEDDVV